VQMIEPQGDRTERGREEGQRDNPGHGGTWSMVSFDRQAMLGKPVARTATVATPSERGRR
jgi:hypothetical protein